MQQRRVRLGDILDDYCPRERRITNHAVVAMIDDTVKQTRCTTCDADHEYREGKAPSPRRRKTAVAEGVLVDARPRRSAAAAPEPSPPEPQEEPAVAEPVEDQPAAFAESPVEQSEPEPEPEPVEDAARDRDEWPVHRPLIRATLPRPEGQTPERKTPDFTFRSSGGRFEPNRNGQRKGGHRPMRHAHGQPSGQGRFGPRAGSGSRTGAGPAQGQGHGQGQGQRHGNRPGTSGGNRPASNRGSRSGGGRKRGR
jgi:hypothetical protein